MKVEKIALKYIEQNENSRVIYKDADLHELMASMKENGLLQPVGVMKTKGGKYDAVFGNRRIMAAKKLGWGEIPAHVLDLDSETDRDLMNLVENFKRQNTTLSEDARMFEVLMARGLSKNELATRLGVTVQRIETALGVLRDLPEEYHRKIANTASGASRKGVITPTVAHQVLSLRKSHNLPRKQVRQLLKFASEGASSQQLSQVAPLLSGGSTLAQALKRAEDTRYVNLEFYVRAKESEKFEKRTGKSIREYFIEWLMKNPELTVEPRRIVHYDKRRAETIRSRAG